eukprot:scaffold96786_cov18-Prasinocladus_malaysianus.AAC.1
MHVHVPPLIANTVSLVTFSRLCGFEGEREQILCTRLASALNLPLQMGNLPRLPPASMASV